MNKRIWINKQFKQSIGMTNFKEGITLRIEKDVNLKIKKTCYNLIKYLRKNYYFPVNIKILIKNEKFLISKDGEKCHGIFWRIDNDYYCNPHIKIAGNQANIFTEEEIEYIVFVILHELTHYYQWINNLKLTPIGEERQANRYAYLILDEFFESLANSKNKNLS